MTHNSAHRPLQLGTLPNPGRPTERVAAFRDWQTACTHLRDHLLTAPECRAWALVAPGYRALLEPDDPDGRWRYWEQAQASAGATAQGLYDLYLAAADADIGEAVHLGWVGTGGGVAVAVGTSGILVIVEGILRTAFLPGQGDPEATRQARVEPDAVRRGLPRERGMRSGRPGHEHIREQRARQQREAAWTAEQHLYYRVVRHSLRFIRQAHHRHRDLHGRLVRQDCALLKPLLPAGRELTFEAWVALRRRFRGG